MVTQVEHRVRTHSWGKIFDEPEELVAQAGRILRRNDMGAPMSFRRRILPACATSSSGSSKIFPHECVRTRRSTCVTIVIYSSGVVDGVSSMYFLHACERSQVDVGVAKLCAHDLFLVFDQRYRAPQ